MRITGHREQYPRYPQAYFPKEVTPDNIYIRLWAVRGLILLVIAAKHLESPLLPR